MKLSWQMTLVVLALIGAAVALYLVAGESEGAALLIGIAGGLIPRAGAIGPGAK